MQVVNASPGTGTSARFSSVEMPIAGKTGTSDNDYNQWFIGLTPYYVAACYLGYDEQDTINYSGYYYPPPIIWKNIMEPIHAELPMANFNYSPNVIERVYCTESGCLATDKCTSTAYGWYNVNNLPADCSAHEPGSTGINFVTEYDPTLPEYREINYWDWLLQRYPTEKNEEQEKKQETMAVDIQASLQLPLP